ncbi:DUF3048 domain-containing protein [Candidatus Falkowbacteria bacterium]|nr:DUF3048 domain-containing protein [Candidatus Falkowbacteria bacterium]
MAKSKNKKSSVAKQSAGVAPRRTGQYIIYFFSMVVALAAIFLLVKVTPVPQSDLPVFPAAAAVCQAYRSLDGVCLTDAAAANLLPVGVMIENYFEARPPHNLTRAQLVYEAVTEGGIPRLLAVYATDEPIDEIGPIRSARPYFVEWAEELRAMYWHSGGSPQALTYLAATNRVYDVNEFSRGAFFWRDSSLNRPHNLFTSSERIQKYQTKIEAKTTGVYQPWTFVDDPELSARQDIATHFSFNYSPYNNYFTEWQYNKQENRYYRFQGGQAHLDSNGEQVSAKNIIFQYIPTYVIDRIGRQDIDTFGSGRILLFQNGGVTEGTWEKTVKGERTLFLNADGSAVRFNRGTTWITAMPIGYEVEY